jgi:pimeloyl-ACP methyl ester carboxylesterase
MPTVNTRAGSVSYEEAGTGSPVVLLHATLHDRHDYDPVIPALARGHRVIALDWPGHGESAPLDAGLEPGGLAYAGVLEDVVSALRLPPAVVVGNSVGGYAAARLAITRPERVAGLVLVNAGGFHLQNALVRAWCRLLGTPLVTRVAMPRLVPSYMKARTAGDEAIVARVVARARTPEGIRTAAALWRSFAAPEYDLRDRAGRLSAPALIVWGTHDTVLPALAGRQTARAIAGSQLVALPTGHVVFSSDPEGFLGAVLPFLDRVFASSRDLAG